MNKPYRTCSRCGANLVHGEKCDCTYPSLFNVKHYGDLIDDYEKEIEGNFIRQQIYKFDDRIYIISMRNGTTYSMH